MLNSGDKNNKYSNSCVVRKKISEQKRTEGYVIVSSK